MADAQGDPAQPLATTKPTAIIARAIRWEYGHLSRLMTSSCRSPRYIPHPVTRVIPPGASPRYIPHLIISD